MSAESGTHSRQSYGTGTRNLMRFLLFQGIAIVFLTAVLLYQIDKGHPSDNYFAETAGGQVQRLINLGTPNVNTEAMLSWAAMAAVDVLTFGFNDADARFASVRGYFTQEGWDSFAQAMVSSELLANVTNFQQIVTSIPSGPPMLVSWGLQDGVYVSVVHVPILMTTRAGSKKIPQNADVLLTIVSMPTSENPRGMGIQNWRSLQ